MSPHTPCMQETSCAGQVMSASQLACCGHPRPQLGLQAGGIQPLHLDMLDLNASIQSLAQLKTPPSFSLLALVEEAVAACAMAFLGTAESSMTGMVVQVSRTLLRDGYRRLRSYAR